MQEGGIDRVRFVQGLPVEDEIDRLAGGGRPGGQQAAAQANRRAEAVVEQRPGHVHRHVVEAVDVVDGQFAQRGRLAQRLAVGGQRLDDEGVAAARRRRRQRRAHHLLHGLAHAPLARVPTAERHGGQRLIGPALIQRAQRPGQLQPGRQRLRRRVPEQFQRQVAARESRLRQFAVAQQPQRSVQPARAVGLRDLRPRGGDDALRPGHIDRAGRVDDAQRLLAGARRQLPGRGQIDERHPDVVAARRHGRRQLQGVMNRARLAGRPVGRAEGGLIDQFRLQRRPDVAGVVGDGQAQRVAAGVGRGDQPLPAGGQAHGLVGGCLGQGGQGQPLAEDGRLGQRRRPDQRRGRGAAVDPGLLQPAEAHCPQQLQPGRGRRRAVGVELPAAEGGDLEVGRGGVVEAIDQGAAGEEGGQRGGDAGDGRALGGVGLRVGQPAAGGADALAPAGGQHARRRPAAAGERVVGRQRVGGVGQPEEGLRADDDGHDRARPTGGNARRHAQRPRGPDRRGGQQQGGHGRQDVAVELLGRGGDGHQEQARPQEQQPDDEPARPPPGPRRTPPQQPGPRQRGQPDHRAEPPDEDDGVEQRAGVEDGPAEEECLAQGFVEVAVGAAADGGQDGGRAGQRPAPQGGVEEEDGCGGGEAIEQPPPDEGRQPPRRGWPRRGPPRRGRPRPRPVVAQRGPEQGQPGHGQQGQRRRLAEHGQAGGDPGQGQPEGRAAAAGQGHGQGQQGQGDKGRAQAIDVEEARQADEEGVEGEQQRRSRGKRKEPHAKTQRRKERKIFLCVFASLRETLFSRPEATGEQVDGDDAEAVDDGHGDAAAAEEEGQAAEGFDVVGRQGRGLGQPEVGVAGGGGKSQLQAHAQRAQPRRRHAGMAGHERARPAAGEQGLAELHGAVDPDQFIGGDVAAHGHQARREADEEEHNGEEPRQPSAHRRRPCRREMRSTPGHSLTYTTH